MISPYFYWPPQFNKKQIKEINNFIINNFNEEENKKVAATVNGDSLKQDESTK